MPRSKLPPIRAPYNFGASILEEFTGPEWSTTGGQSSLDTSLDIEKIQEKRTKRKVDTVDALLDQINNAFTEEQLLYSGKNLPVLETLVGDNPEALIKLQTTSNTLQNNANDFLSYKSQINYMSGLRDSVVEVKDENGNLSSAPAGWINHTEDDMSKYSLDYVQSELRAIENFRSTLYKDPVNKKDPLPFIGHYSPDGKITDIALINDVEKREQVLLAAVAAMAENGIIDKHEMYYVVTGDKAGLDARRIEVLKDTRVMIKSNLSSKNAIKKYKKQLLNTIAKENLKGDELFAGLEGVNMESLYQSYNIDMENPYFEGMDMDTYIQEKNLQYSEMSINDVLKQWDSELHAYQLSLDFELDKFLKWSGTEYMADTDKKERAERRGLLEILQQQ